MDHLANTRGEGIGQRLLLIFIAAALVLIALTWLENIRPAEPDVPSYYRSVATSVAPPPAVEATLTPGPRDHAGGGRRHAESAPAAPAGIPSAGSDSSDAMIDQ